MSARRVVSGARDKTALIQDFWQKMLDVTAAGESGEEDTKHSNLMNEKKAIFLWEILQVAAGAGGGRRRRRRTRREKGTPGGSPGSSKAEDTTPAEAAVPSRGGGGTTENEKKEIIYAFSNQNREFLRIIPLVKQT